MTILYVAFGGAIGAVLRYAVAVTVTFPYATMAVNIVGSFLMGLAVVILADKGWDRAAPFVMAGLLGGFTTFSAFSLDALRLFEKGQMGGAAAYVFGTVMLCILACFFGAWLARVIGS